LVRDDLQKSVSKHHMVHAQELETFKNNTQEDLCKMQRRDSSRSPLVSCWQIFAKFWREKYDLNLYHEKMAQIHQIFKENFSNRQNFMMSFSG
jgi:hypothetical protein